MVSKENHSITKTGVCRNQIISLLFQYILNTELKPINYLVCNNKKSLLWIANLGAIEMHPWYSRIKDFESCDKSSLLYEEKCGLNFPDFIVFDLDPYIYSGEEKKGQEPEYNTKGFKGSS